MKKIIASMLLSGLVVTAGATPPGLTALFDADWQWSLGRYPETATALGDARYNDRLTDTRLRAQLSNNRHEQDMLREALKIPAAGLDAQDQLALQLFIGDKQERLDAIAFYPTPVQPVSQLDGIQFSLPALVSHTPFSTAFDYYRYLARLHGLSAYVDGVIEQLRQGIKTGWVAPRVIIEPVPAQLRALRLPLQQGALAKPFQHFPANLAKPEVFSQLGQQELMQHVAPALARLEKFIRTEYLPACRDSIAASDLPGGAAYYDFLVRTYTSTELSPAQIHALGLSEVERLQTAMQALMAQTGFHGSVAEFSHFLHTDPRVHEGQPANPLHSQRSALRAEATLTAFREGWALYVQTLAQAREIDHTPAEQFVKLNEEIGQVLPLVVDTGIHAMHWDRAAAIVYLNDHRANSPDENSVEVDRSIARPAQAMAAKIGQLNITALRDKARLALGEKFDQDAFDEAVLSNGALPLSILANQIERWIAQQQYPPT